MDLAATLSVVKEKMNTVKNVVMNYSETEAKVRKATDNEAWGPSGTEMSQLAQLTNYIEDFQTIMEIIYKRVWRGGLAGLVTRGGRLTSLEPDPHAPRCPVRRARQELAPCVQGVDLARVPD